MDCKVSIIIPCYNQANFLPDAIKSALNQTHKNKEIVVVNDGSQDNVLGVVQYFKQRKSKDDTQIIYLEQENRGLSSARNTGIKFATGEWIVCLDSDDKLAPNYIEKTIGLSDIVGTGTVEFGNRSRIWKAPFHYIEYNHLLIKNRLNYAAIFKKQVWQKVGGYDEQMNIGFEDYRFWLDAAKAGFKIRLTNDFLFYYRKHDKSMFAEALKRKEEIRNYIRQFHNLI